MSNYILNVPLLMYFKDKNTPFPKIKKNIKAIPPKIYQKKKQTPKQKLKKNRVTLIYSFAKSKKLYLLTARHALKEAQRIIY